jgi:hypothetical protein
MPQGLLRCNVAVHTGAVMRAYAGNLPVLLDADLSNAGWNGSLNPYPGIPDIQYAYQSLRKSLLKKFQDEITAEADKRALELFLKINSNCSQWSLTEQPITEAETIALGEAKEFLYRFFHYADQTKGDLFVLNQTSIAKHISLGNGANIGSPGTDFLSKIGLGTMAATNPALHKLYVQTISSMPSWADVESIRQANRPTEVVQGSRLAFVPKTTEISRTICTEPICNMLWQKGIGLVLEDRMREVVGIDLANQADKNRLLARLGSQNGEFGTIDLSSASDSMSLSLVREFFPRQVVSWLEMTRSPITILPDGTEVELHMISSMGNAYTFPLQTIFFTSLVYASYRMLGITFERPFRDSLGNFAVFGDDIIVQKKAYGFLCRLLSICGFSVNVDKSFNEGLFRESCGHDYYYGYNVRGVYIKTLKTVNDRYSAINRLNMWSATHRTPLPNVIGFLLRGDRLLPIPPDESDDAGVKVPVSMLKKIVRDPFTGGIRYRCWVPNQTSYNVTDSESHPPKIKGWFNNPSAILVAALAGTLRKGKVVTRSSRRSYRLKVRHSSCWGYVRPHPGYSYSQDFGERWKSFVELNLNFS